MARLMLVALFWCMVVGLAVAQRATLDSLLQKLPTQAEDTTKVTLYHGIADRYLTLDLDSVPFYAQSGLNLAKALQDLRGQVRCLNVLGNYHERKTQYEQALAHYQEALALVEAQPYAEGFAIVLNNISIIYIRKGNYPKALEYLFDALDYEEQLGNLRGVAEAYNNIGVVYYYQQNIPKTLEYFEQSIKIEEQLDQPDLLKKGYNNLGALYDYQKNYSKALEYYQKSYTLSQKLQDRQEMALNLNNIATAYIGLGQIDTAETYLTRAVALREALGDHRGVAHTYLNFAILFRNRAQYTLALEYFERCHQITAANQLRELESERYKGLAELEEQRQDYAAANAYWKQFMAVKDSLINEESSKAIAEIESKYEVAKKEKSLLEQQLQIDQQQLQLEQKNNQLLLLGGTSLLLLLLGGFSVYYLRQRNQQLERERQLQAAQATIATQEQLQEQRFRISRDLHDNIGAQLTFIISSVENLPYRFELQPALTERLQGIGQFTRQTIQELRDTIWVMNKGSITAADLEERIRQFVHQAQGATAQTQLHVAIDPALQAVPPLPATKGMHLYRLLQEATNNALKHAQAAHLYIRLQQQGQEWQLVVQDDGRGFDPSQQAVWNNGLHHLHQRAQALEGTCTIESQPSHGTTVTVTLPFDTWSAAVA